MLPETFHFLYKVIIKDLLDYFKCKWIKEQFLKNARSKLWKYSIFSFLLKLKSSIPHFISLERSPKYSSEFLTFWNLRKPQPSNQFYLPCKIHFTCLQYRLVLLISWHWVIPFPASDSSKLLLSSSPSRRERLSTSTLQQGTEL